MHNETLHLKNLLYHINTCISISETNEFRLTEWGVELLAEGGVTLKDNEFKRRVEGRERRKEHEKESERLGKVQ